MAERKTIQLELTCVDFPDKNVYPGLFLGLVEHQQTVQEVTLDQANAQGEVGFHTTLEVLLDEARQTVTFYGPAAQGPPKERFVYLSWRKQAADGWLLTSRIKIPLNIFSPTHVARVLNEDQPLRLQVRVKDHKGKPAAASLKGDSLTVLG